MKRFTATINLPQHILFFFKNSGVPEVRDTLTTTKRGYFPRVFRKNDFERNGKTITVEVSKSYGDDVFFECSGPFAGELYPRSYLKDIQESFYTRAEVEEMIASGFMTALEEGKKDTGFLFRLAFDFHVWGNYDGVDSIINAIMAKFILQLSEKPDEFILSLAQSHYGMTFAVENGKWYLQE